MPSLFKEIFQLAFRRFVKDRGRFPTPAERDMIQDMAQKEARKQMENIDPVFKGFDKMDPDKPFRGFKPKVVPKEGELSVTIEGKTKNMTPEGIMDFLMGKGKAKDTNIGKAPKTTAETKKKKSMIDPKLTEEENIKKMMEENKKAVKRFEEKFGKKDREDFSIGGGVMRIIKALGEKSPLQRYKDYLASVKKRSQEGDMKSLAPEMAAITSGGVLVNRMLQRTLSDMKEADKEINLENFKQQLENDPFYQERPELKDEVLEKYVETMFGEEKANGGRIGFSGGGAGLPAATGGDMVYSSGARIPGAPNIPMGEFETGIGPILLGIYGQGGFSDNPVAPDIPVDVATTEQQYGIATQIPIGDTGFTIGANYDKSRVNQRFTGDLIPNQVFKSVPVDEDRFNVGINFTKSFQEGGPVDPDRRTFIKILGGLASIPILSKFVTPLKQVAPVVAETAKEVPAYFFKLVDKIRRLGDDAPGLTTIERESGKKYKNYEMVEDQTTGDIIIKKQKQGSTMVGDDMVEGTMSEEVLAYRTPKNTPEGRLPADYEEITVRPDFEGKMRDVEDGLDSMSEILEEVGEAQLKKAGGGLAYMLGE